MNPYPNQSPDKAVDPTAAPVDTPTSSAPEVTETPASNSFAAASDPVTTETTSAPQEATVIPQTPVVSAESAASPFATQNTVAPVATDPTAPVISGTGLNAGPPKKSNKKIAILIGAIVAGLLVLGGAALAVYMMFFAVTKADYQKAYDQVSVVRDAYSDGNGSSGSNAAALDGKKVAFEKFKTESAKLADFKAFKADKELRDKYAAYETKSKAFIAFGDSYIPSLEALIGAADDVEAIGSASTVLTSSANVQKALDIYNGINVTNETLKMYVDSTIEMYTTVLPQAKIYESSTATNSEKSSALRKISSALSKLSSASSDMSKDIRAQTDAVALSDDLNNLGKAVTAKLNKS